MMWFNECHTPAEVKSAYRRLAMQHHPDHGGDTGRMQDINSQYHDALQNLDQYETPGNDEKVHTYYYNSANEQSIMDKLDELLKAKFPAGIEIWLIGTWLWIRGTTYEDTSTRSKLKDAKCIWHGKRREWYWKPEGYRSSYAKNLSLDDLASIYGASVYEPEEQQQPTPAATIA